MNCFSWDAEVLALNLYILSILILFIMDSAVDIDEFEHLDEDQRTRMLVNLR